MANKCPKCDSDNLDTSRFCAECGTQLQPSEEIPASPTKTLETPIEKLTTGSTFAGRYQIIEELGKGGMGKVYRALDKKLNEEVALKLIKPEIASDEKTLERFRNELKLARRIAHKNVGRMYELLEEKGTHYITMEYIPGQDLRGLIRQTGQLAIGSSISIAEQICEGLAEAHRLGVVHRDLKPSNIMIDKEGNVRVMDFGIARSLRTRGITGAGIMVGTPEYMSPEQAESKEVDQRSDIYSLGIILYEMLTGQLPFEGDTPLAVAMKHKSEMPRNPKDLNPQISDELSQIILKCLEKGKEKRYQSTGEVRAELSGIEKGIPTTEREIPRRKPITSKEITVTFGLKKLFIPALAIIVLAIIVVVIWKFFPQKEAITLPPSKASLAVLPFVDMSPQKDQEYFCDGMAEELISALTKIKDLRIIARTSAFSFKGKGLDVREIGEKLNVDMVVEGSIRKADSRLRITAQLINVEDGYPLWSERYERAMDDIFLIQDEVTMAIVNNLKVELLGEEKTELMKHHTENLEAYNLYLQGRYFWNKRTEEGYQKCLEYFQKAIETDPTYALAYTGIADCYNLLGYYGFLPPKEAFPEAKRAAEKALEMDETLAEAHTSLAWVRWHYDWDWEGAEREFKRALELNPSYATAHHWYSTYLGSMGRHDESMVEAKRALELDPLSLVIIANMGGRFFGMGQYDRAIEEYQKALNLDPNFYLSHFYIVFSYAMKGMYNEAVVEAQKTIDLLGGDNLGLTAVLGYMYAASGRREEAEKILSEVVELSKQRYVPPYGVALIYTGLGQKNQAFQWLEKAYEDRDHWLVDLKSHPMLDSLRSDPRFQVLLKRMNLE